MKIASVRLHMRVNPREHFSSGAGSTRFHDGEPADEVRVYSVSGMVVQYIEYAKLRYHVVSRSKCDT